VPAQDHDRRHFSRRGETTAHTGKPALAVSLLNFLAATFSRCLAWLTDFATRNGGAYRPSRVQQRRRVETCPRADGPPFMRENTSLALPATAAASVRAEPRAGRDVWRVEPPLATLPSIARKRDSEPDGGVLHSLSARRHGWVRSDSVTDVDEFVAASRLWQKSPTSDYVKKLRRSPCRLLIASRRRPKGPKSRGSRVASPARRPALCRFNRLRTRIAHRWLSALSNRRPTRRRSITSSEFSINACGRRRLMLRIAGSASSGPGK